MYVRLLQTRQFASLNLYLLERPQDEPRSRKYRRIVVGCAFDPRSERFVRSLMMSLGRWQIHW